MESVIIGERGSGRTTELIKLSAKEDIRILCFSVRELTMVTERAVELGLKIPTPKLYAGKWFPSEPFLIDNLDYVLQRLLGVKIAGGTLEAVGSKPHKYSGEKLEMQKRGNPCSEIPPLFSKIKSGILKEQLHRIVESGKISASSLESEYILLRESGEDHPQAIKALLDIYGIKPINYKGKIFYV